MGRGRDVRWQFGWQFLEPGTLGEPHSILDKFNAAFFQNVQHTIDCRRRTGNHFLARRFPTRVNSSEPSGACLSLNDRFCDFELPVSLVILCRAGLRRNAMKSDGFPNAVAVALAFAVSLFAAFAFGGLP